MASATLRHDSKSRNISTQRPRTPLIGLRDYVARCFPHEYRLTCDYDVEGRTIVRSKRFLGTVVDRRPIGLIPDGMEAAKVFIEDFSGVVLGEPESIERIKRLESEFWHVSNSIANMFTIPAAPSIPASRLERGLA